MKRVLAILMLMSAAGAAIVCLAPSPGVSDESPGPAVAPAGPKVMVYGLSLGRSVPGSGRDKGLPWRHLSGGTKLYVAVIDGDSRFLGVDEKACALTRFVDDKGTVLREPEGGERARWWLLSPEFETDRHTVSFQVHGRLPAKGATAVRLQGTVALQDRGADPQQVVGKIARCRKGEAFRAGPLEITLSDVGPGVARDRQQFLELSSKTDLARVRSLTFLDSEGNTIDHWRKDLSQTVGQDKETVYRMGLYLRWRVWDKPLTIKISWFTGTETVKVPLDAAVGLGL